LRLGRCGFVSWSFGGGLGGVEVYSKAFRLASVKTLIVSFSMCKIDGMQLEEDTRSLDPYISLGDVLHNIFKSFRSLGNLNFKRGARRHLVLQPYINLYEDIWYTSLLAPYKLTVRSWV
jgi:hypothetical protein